MKKKIRSKKLETVKGVNIQNVYHGKEVGVFEKMMVNMIGNKAIKHSYYELVNKRGKVVQIVDTKEEHLVQSAAYRMGLNYRLVEFEVTYKDLDEEAKE